MPLKYNGLLIAQAREETGETDYSDDNGVPQSVAIQALREAVIHCQNTLYLTAPRIFDVISLLDPVASQIEYELPETTYLGSSIAFVRYSHDGDERNYYNLDLADYIYRVGAVSSEPRRFTPYGERSILVDPPLDSARGKFQVFHGRHLDEPDIRRGKIENVTNNVTEYQTIVLANDTNLDATGIGLEEYICVNDKDGNVKFYNVHYDSYDSSSRTLTLTPGSALMSGGSITIGDYITLGKYTTTHVKLDRIAAPVLLAYLRRRFYLGKSSEDVTGENENIKVFTQEMERSYRKTYRSAKRVPYRGKFEGV